MYYYIVVSSKSRCLSIYLSIHLTVYLTVFLSFHSYNFSFLLLFPTSYVLTYLGKFDQFLNTKLFQQGEGLVNTVGGFYGEKKLLKAMLADWKILRGDAPFKYVYNWNGEISPVVHQMDRYLQNEIKGGYRAHLAVFQKLGGPF